MSKYLELCLRHGIVGSKYKCILNFGDMIPTDSQRLSSSTCKSVCPFSQHCVVSDFLLGKVHLMTLEDTYEMLS